MGHLSYKNHHCRHGSCIVLTLKLLLFAQGACKLVRVTVRKSIPLCHKLHLFLICMELEASSPFQENMVIHHGGAMAGTLPEPATSCLSS